MFHILSLLALATAALATKVQVKSASGTISDPQTTYDPIYQDASESTSVLDCAGTLINKNAAWTTFGELPRFPNIGGSDVVTGYDSAGCGTCWALSYQGNTVNVLVVDYAEEGFNIAESTFAQLAPVSDGVIDVTAEQVAASVCHW